MGAPTRVTNLNDYIRLQRGEKKEQKKGKLSSKAGLSDQS